MLNGSTVVVGITGSIAAYKMADVVSALTQMECDVYVVMTEHATNIINPITFETLTGHKCLIDTFDRNFNYNIEHVALGEKADAFIIAPATANTVAKLAHGIADDMLTTLAISSKCKKIIAPAMNTAMYENPVFLDNLNKCKEYGMSVITPATGHLACKADGIGKLPEKDIIIEHIAKAVRTEKNMAGKKVLVTAGATREALDPVRFITNHSTGKMGYAIAKVAMLRGADVTLVSAPTNLRPPIDVKVVDVVSAKDMFEAVKELAPDMDVIVKTAAVSDFTPTEYSEEKIKKGVGELELKLKRTEDILAYVGKHKKEGQYVCGFSMETKDLIDNSIDKLYSKNADLIVANDLNDEGAGFGTETNTVTLIMPEGIAQLPCMSKEFVAESILDLIVN